MPELAPPAEIVATESAPVTNLSELTPEQRQEWRKTGEFPKSKAADSAPAKEEVKEVPEVADSEHCKAMMYLSLPEQIWVTPIKKLLEKRQ